MQQKQVVIYTTPTCAYCRMAKDYFAKNNITYTQYDVASDAAKRQEMLDKTGQLGVPVILIGTDVVIGFDKEAIDQLLDIRH